MATTAGTRGFAMQGARAAMNEWLPHIEEQVEGLERAVVDNPGLAFDLARTVVESVCRAILSDLGVVFGEDDDLPQLFREVTLRLPLLPTTASGEAQARRSVAQVMSGLHSSLQGICELRNAYGFASHGSGSTRPLLESAQALLAAQAADTIVGFLHQVHRRDRTPSGARLAYEANTDFNGYVDDANDMVRIFDLEYRPSEVLFNVDGEAYRDLLAGYAPDRSGEDDEPPTEMAASA